MARAWVWGVVILLAAAAGGWLFFAGAPGQARDSDDAARAREQVMDKDPVQVQQERLTLAVLGVDARLVEARPEAGGWTVGIEMSDVPPSESRMFQKVMSALKEVARTEVPIRHATVVLRSDDLKDVYGNTLKDVVIGRLQLGGTAFERINWHGFEPRNFRRLADEWWLHPEVSTLEQEQQEAAGSGPGGGSGGGGSGGSGGGGGGGGGGSS